MILRPDYMNAIKPFMDVKIVKILAGVRRSGKSTIFNMIKDELCLKGIPLSNIIIRRYTDNIHESYNATQMYNDLKESIISKGRCYLLLDELQEIVGWEKVVNSLFEDEDVDIYITGSNSKLMSSEISTYLSGRYISIPVYTLSYEEYLTFKGFSRQAQNDLLMEYIQYGGFPLVALNNFDTHSAYQVVEGIYSSVISRDIAERHEIRNQDLFDRVVKYIIENVGKTFSANTIVSFLKNEKRTISVEAIYNYIKWLTEAFIIYPCSRYDLKGKSVLKTLEKYYLSDISFKYSKQGYNGSMLSSILENIVFLELKRRGYEAYVGKNYTKEIDFVGINLNEKVYIQVCKELPHESNREIDNLNDISDHYHKYVVTLDKLAKGIENGIEIIYLGDFLLRKQW
jgi:predicted AAA+ superfamily ATPase